MRSVICDYCDAVYRRTVLPRRTIARCENCDGILYKTRTDSIGSMLALATAAVIAFVLAMTMPIMTLVNAGTQTHATIWDAVSSAYSNGVAGVAVIAATTLFLFPLFEITLYLWILIPLRARRVPPRFQTAMLILRLLRPWSMVEVFMLGVVVAIMKLGTVADVHPEPGVVGFGALALLLVALASFDRRELWDAADEMRK